MLDRNVPVRARRQDELTQRESGHLTSVHGGEVTQDKEPAAAGPLSTLRFLQVRCYV